MPAFILRRLIQAVIVMIVVAFIAFMLFQYVGDPVVFLLWLDATPAQISQMLMTISLLGVSLPTFLIGILLILVFAVGLGWFPSFGRGETVQLGWWSTGLLKAEGWHHIVLPAVTLAIFQLTLIMRLVRAE